MTIHDFDNGVYIIEDDGEFIVRQEFPQIYFDNIIAISNDFDEATEIAKEFAKESRSNILTEDELYEFENGLIIFD